MLIFKKKISNLERQLRNRNKDYLFALKELEKVKLCNSKLFLNEKEREKEKEREREMIPLELSQSRTLLLRQAF